MTQLKALSQKAELGVFTLRCRYIHHEIKLHKLFQKEYFLFISTETLTDTKSTVAVFNKENSQLQNTVFQPQSISAGNEKAFARNTHKNMHQQR